MLLMLQLLELDLSLEEVKHLICHDISSLVYFKPLMIMKNLCTLNPMYLLTFVLFLEYLNLQLHLHLILEFPLLLHTVLLSQDFFLHATSDDLITFDFKLFFLGLKYLIFLALVLVKPTE